MDQFYSVRNGSGATILKGRAVYVYGATQGTLGVKLAKADSSGTLPCFGLAFDDIPDKAIGRVLAFGRLPNLNTSLYPIGAHLFVSSVDAGFLTATAPASPGIQQLVAHVVLNGVSNGSLEVVAGMSQTLTSGLIAHASTHYIGGSDPLNGLLNANARLSVLLNGTGIGLRRAVNLIQGGNATLLVVDNPASERVDVTISAAAGGGTGTASWSRLILIMGA